MTAAGSRFSGRPRPFVPLVLALTAGLAVAAWAAPPPRQPKEEEEAPTRTPPRKILRVEDEGKKPAAPREKDVVRPPVGGDTTSNTLLEESLNAEQPAVRDLFRDLARPYDQVTKTKGGYWKVAPLPWPLGTRPEEPGELRIMKFDDHGKLWKIPGVTADQIANVKPYEQIALDRVRRFLDQKAQDSGEGPAPTRLQRLEAAEKALATVIGFHESFKEKNERGGPRGEAIEKELRDLLWNVQRERLKILCDASQWEDAFAVGTDLAQAYAGQDDKQEQLSELLAQLVWEPLKRHDYQVVGRRLHGLEGQFRQSKALAAIRQELRTQAAAKFARAREAGDAAQAQALLNEAQVIDSSLPGLHEAVIRLSREHAIAYVGVRRPPSREYLSPYTACTDTDRQGVELMYSSLVKLVEESAGDQRFQYYVPDLAAGEPLTIPLGRRFRLDRRAGWSDDGRPVTAEDVRQTWQVLQQQGQSRLLARVEPGNDPFVVDVVLDQGYLDPLSLMTFKILPAGTPAPDAADFRAKFLSHPVGSGPYRLHSAEAEKTVFAANPYYRRGDHNDLPHIREIHFVRSANPTADFTGDRLHLLLDLPSKDVHNVRSAAGVRIMTLRNRRIYFLAVNHRNPTLGGSAGEALRGVLANAIDREKILNDLFRDREEPTVQESHRVLNGPFPPDCWASDKNVRAFDVKLAREKAREVAARATAKEFRLKYSRDDEQAEAVARAIQDQVGSLGVGITINLIPRSPDELRQDVEVTHDYELAYYSYDYPSEAYQLAPLLDASEVKDHGGRNYLGYANDGELDQKLREATQHRDFQDVKKAMFEIHRLVHQRLPFIPLWQLDTHVAIHPDLQVTRISPLTVFSDVENWRLEKR